ncbi:MAG: peptidylprolyl isomerase [Saprospiraceae bacterium]
MKNKFILFLLMLAFQLSTAQKQIIDKIVCEVGNEVILFSDLAEQIKLIESRQGVVKPEEKCYMLENMMVSKLLVHQAFIDSVVVSDNEIEAQLDARVERILESMGNDVTQFEAYYGKSVNDVKSDFREDLKNQLVAEKMKNTLMEDIHITPSEVKQYYNRIPKDSMPYLSSEVEVSEIVKFPVPNDSSKERAKDKLLKVQARLNAGEKFEDLAATFSDDLGSARTGGDLGWAKRGSFVAEYEAAAYNLEPGQYSSIIETEFGFHLIQLLELRGNTIHTRHILIKPVIEQVDLDLAKSQLVEARRLILKDSITFSQAVKKYGHKKEQSYNNDGRITNPKSGDTFFEIRDLEPEVYFTLDTMKIQGISSPVELIAPTGEKYYKILYLNTRTDPHQANLKQDYAKFQGMAREAKKNDILVKWLEDHVSSTYVRIDPIFLSCPNVAQWLNKKDKP